MKTPTVPQVWTSETVAVRALAALGIAHPAEFASALSTLTGRKLDPVDPATIRCEDQRTDLHFSTRDNQELLIEAKIDDFVSVEQMDRYTDKFPEAIGIVLVPETDAPDVRDVRAARPNLDAISWGDVLDLLADVNPLAGQLRDDISTLSALPSTKARLRRLMRQALNSAQPGPEVRIVPAVTGRRYPCLDVSVTDTYVFGQVEAGHKPAKPPRFHATVGFAVDRSDETDRDANRRVRHALKRAWLVAERLERQGTVRLSRHRRTSEQQKIYGMAQPYQARGYRGSYVGVRTKWSEDPDQIVSWALSLAGELEAVTRAVWPRRVAETS